MTGDFGTALRAMQSGIPYRRDEWRPDKLVVVRSNVAGSLPYLEIRMKDGRAAPFVPSQCDLFAKDWVPASVTDDFSCDPRRWSLDELVRERRNGMPAVVAEWERRATGAEG